MAKPLYYLLKKRAKFEFAETELCAFEQLRDKLLKLPVLAIYSPKLETELHCDASTHGYGAVLMQKQNYNLFRPTFYLLLRTSSAESLYHSYELEMLAIVNALNRFRAYLHGIIFKIATDCNNQISIKQERD